MPIYVHNYLHCNQKLKLKKLMQFLLGICLLPLLNCNLNTFTRMQSDFVISDKVGIYIHTYLQIHILYIVYMYEMCLLKFRNNQSLT